MVNNVPNPGGIRVLLVEDVALEAKLVVRALADRGFTDVVHFSDAESACAAVETGQPCIVVTDLELPRLSGIDLVKRVRARVGAGVYVYTIVLTGKSNPVRLREAFDAGADDYMVKPFQREELVARVRVGERIVRLERAAYLRAAELEAALRKIDETEATAALARAKERERTAPHDRRRGTPRIGAVGGAARHAAQGSRGLRRIGDRRHDVRSGHRDRRRRHARGCRAAARGRARGRGRRQDDGCTLHAGPR